MTTSVSAFDDAIETGERIHMLMWRGGLSIRAMGPRVGVDQSSLSKKIRGKSPWYLHEIRSIARELGTSVSYLVGETDDPQADPDGPDGGSKVRREGIEPPTQWLGVSRRSARLSVYPERRLQPVAAPGIAA